MIESKDWMKRYYRRDIRDMAAYVKAEDKRLSELRRLRRKRHSPLYGFLLWSSIRSSKYDRDYFRRSLKADKGKLRKVV